MMAKTLKAKFEGRLITIPTDTGVGLAKVLFCPAREKDTVLLKIFEKSVSPMLAVTEEDFGGDFELRYARAHALKSGAWPVFRDQGVDTGDFEMTKRISGGEVWIGDEHIGPASDVEERSVQKMLIYGERLIEKFVAGLTPRPEKN